MVSQTTQIQKIYEESVAAKVTEHFGLRNAHQLPRLTKVVVNCGIGRFLENQKLKPDIRDSVTGTLTAITGQKPVMVKAKKSVSNFKVRLGNETGLKVTLRGARMYEFLDRLLNMAIPRVRDFRGLNPQSFDGQGNYSLGMSEQTAFPEIDPNKVDHPQGMNITVVTTARNDTEGRELLTRFGFPFRT